MLPVGGALKLAVFVGITFLLFPEMLFKRSVIALIFYFIVTLVYFVRGNAFFSTINSVIVPFLSMLSPLLIFEYAAKYDRDYKYSQMVVYTVIVVNIIMSIISIPQVYINPTIVRATDVAIGEESFKYWIINYGTIHGLPFLLAPMVFLVRRIFHKNKWLCIFWLIAIFIIFYIIVISDATTAMLLSILMILLPIVISKERFDVKSVFQFLIIGILLLVMMQPSVMVPIIDGIQSTMNESSTNYQKMGEIKDVFIYGEADGDLGARQDLYNSSWKLFVESPLIGTQHPEQISKHTWLIDRLACFGIVFFIPIILLFFSHIKKVYLGLNHTRVVYVFGVCGYMVMLYLKNDFGTGTWLYAFAILPLLCRYADYTLNHKIIKQNDF